MASTSEPPGDGTLRRRARRQLESGTAPPLHESWAAGTESLNTLYQLASDPDKAADALKLLHELQVHQVELALQQEQMAETEREAVQSLAQSRELFELAPLGYFVVDRAGVVVDVNRAGIRLLGVDRDAVVGREFAGFLASESRPALLGLFAALHGQGEAASCDVQLNQSRQAAHIAASMSPREDIVLMIISEPLPRREA